MTKKPIHPSDLADKFMLRMPDGMRENISDAAKSNNRSMNSEVLYRLQQSFDPDPIFEGVLPGDSDFEKLDDEGRITLLYELVEKQMSQVQHHLDLARFLNNEIHQYGLRKLGVKFITRESLDFEQDTGEPS